MKSREEFLSERAKFAALTGKPDLYEIADHFGLYSGSWTIGSKLFTYELMKRTMDLAGDVIEFGCWNGSNLLFLAKVLYLHRPLSVKRVFGFDNFAGLPPSSSEDGDYAKVQEGNYTGHEAQLRAAIELFDLSGRVQLVVGDARETIPKFQADSPERMVSFAFFDFDLYEPTKVALEFIDKALVDGGIMVFDQAGTEHWPGETLALKEFLDSSDSRYKSIANHITPQPTMAFQKMGSR